MPDISHTILEKINKAITNQNTTLDLHNCELKKIPVEVFKLTHLKELNISKNEITDISGLSELTNLTRLNISKNNITDISPLSKLKNLKKIGLIKNKVKDISALSELTNLMVLSLQHNNITDISALSKLINLIHLGLSNTGVIDLSSLSNLSNLSRLYIVKSQVTDISALSAFENLTELALSGNQITDISALSALKNLTMLSLSGNQITDISALSGLTNLTKLNLTKNLITDILGLSELLKKNKAMELICNDNTFQNNRINISNNPLHNPPISVIEQGREAFLTYVKDFKEQGIGKINEAKLIIVGEPEAGKTTLMNKLLNPEYDLALNKTKATVGVVVKKWSFKRLEEKSDFLVNIWDFGGQQIQYMTHQFFLTPDAVYVLVSANDRKEPTNFPYWFKIIHLLGEAQGRYSPVLVVLNEKDKEFINKFNFDRKFYEERYPELQINVREVDLNINDANYDSLRQTIESMLIKLPHVNDNRPAKWNDIREELVNEGKRHNYINFERYAQICGRYSVNNESSQKVLSGYLHSIGSLLHFVEDVSLRDFIILNPQWAVDAVYSVLVDNEIAHANGYFKKAKLDIVWKKYSVYERQNLLNLMKKENFEICYELIDDTDTLVAPQLLKTERPEYQWDNINTLKFRFRYKFMPEGIITRLIVRLNALVADKLVWNKGVILQDNHCKALVLEEENIDGLKVVDIGVSGDIIKRKYLLHMIREEIKKIHVKWFKNIEFEQMIPCNCEVCIKDSKPTYFEYSELEQYQNESERYIKCKNEKIKNVEVLPMLEGIFTSEELESTRDNSINVVINTTTNEGDVVKNKIEIKGNAKVNNAVIANKIENSFNKISKANSTDDIKELLNTLNKEALKVLEKLDEDKQEEFVTDVELLTDEALKEKPSKKYLNMSVQGVVDATKSVGEVGNILLEVIPKITQYFS